MLAGLLLLAVPAGAAVTVTHSPADLAAAIARDPSSVTSASFSVVPSPAAATKTAGVGPSYGSGPAITSLDGSALAVLSSGDVSTTGPQAQAEGYDWGTTARGAHDVTILHLGIDVPASANCLVVGFDYLSEDFGQPWAPGFQDRFLAELDPPAPWSFSSSTGTVDAPADFALDAQGHAISADSQGPGGTGFNGAPVSNNAAGTPYNGGLGWAYAMTPVVPGAHSLDLSIFDAGDHISDSLVAVDDLRAIRRSDGHCPRGLAVAPDLDAPTVSLSSPVDGATLTDSAPALSGTASSGATDSSLVSVALYAGAQPSGPPVQTISPGVSGGQWQATPAALAPGTYTAQAQQIDAAGNVGLSAPHTFTVQAPTPVDAAPTTPLAAPVATPGTTQLAAALNADVTAAAQALGRVSITTLLKRAGVTVTGLDALTPGTFRVELTVSGGTGASAAKRVVVATGTRRVTSAGHYSLKTTLTTRGKRLLRGARRVTAVLAVRFSPTSGAAVTRSAKVKLKR
jgi:hypothetical protein